MVEVAKEDRVRPTVNVGSGGNVAFADAKDIEPQSATVSLTKGAVAGAVLGTIPAAGIYAAKNVDAVDVLLSARAMESKSEAFVEGMKQASTSIQEAKGGKAALAVIAGTAVLGAVLHYLPTRVHNKWSERVAASTLNRQQQQTQIG